MRCGGFWCRYLVEVPEGSGARCGGQVLEGCGAEVPVPRLGQVPEGSGAQVRFRKVPVQRLGEVLEGSGADAGVSFRKVPVQMRRSASGRFRCRG